MAVAVKIVEERRPKGLENFFFTFLLFLIKFVIIQLHVSILAMKKKTDRKKKKFRISTLT